MDADIKKTCRTCKYAGEYPTQPITSPCAKPNMICRALPPMAHTGREPLGFRPFPVVLADEDWCGYWRHVGEKMPVTVAAADLTINIKAWSKEEFDEFKDLLALRLCWDCGRMLDYGEKCHCENDE